MREDAIAAQVDDKLATLALKPAAADAMVAELEKERGSYDEDLAARIKTTKAAAAAEQREIEVLLDLRLKEQIGEDEYVPKKLILVNRKAEILGKLEAYSTQRTNRFEPAIRFVLEAKSLGILLTQGNREQKRDFLKKSVRTYWCPKNRWP